MFGGDKYCVEKNKDNDQPIETLTFHNSSHFESETERIVKYIFVF